MRLLAALLLVLLGAGAAAAQESLPVVACGTLPQAYKPGLLSHQTVDLNGNLCISGNISAATSLNAAAALPTLGAGTQSLQGSLAGALYVQPAFGTASGGGTQVDLTHGLPVNIVAGGGAGGTSSSFAAAFPASGTAAGFTDGVNMQPGRVDGSGNLQVDLQTALPAGANAIGSVSVSNFPATQPVSGTVTANQGGAPWSVNAAQINGVTPLMGNGATGTGSPRVTLASDNSNSAGIGGSATGSAVPSAARYIGGNGSGNLTGVVVCDNWTAISQTGNTKIISGVSAKQTYFCSINIVTATAQNVALLSGTGSTCGTSPHAIAGGTTAATGWNFAANGGLTQGSGVGAIMRTGTAADDVCIFQSGAGQLSGAVTWTQF